MAQGALFEIKASGVGAALTSSVRQGLSDKGCQTGAESTTQRYNEPRDRRVHG